MTNIIEAFLLPGNAYPRPMLRDAFHLVRVFVHTGRLYRMRSSMHQWLSARWWRHLLQPHCCTLMGWQACQDGSK